MPASGIKLSIIVLFYYGEHWIETCISSLENQSLPRDLYEIIMVNNGGSTPSVGKYDGRQNIKALHFPENYGFAGGNNRALAHARGEIVLLMNQDVVVHFKCLEELLKAFDQHPEAGVVSANMLMVSEKDVVDPYGSTSRTVGLYRLSPLGYASYFLTETDKDIVPVDFVSGNALGFRKIILKDIGNYLFDSRLGSYMEDLDFSIRLKKTEWQMYVRSKALVYHYRDEAFSGKLSYMLGKLIHVSSNRLMVYYNNLTMTDFLKKLPAMLLGIPFKVARQDDDRRFHILKFIVAFAFTPLVLVYFGLRILANIKPRKEAKHVMKKAQTNRKN
jgi:N-acetylglucosaminyl-diphospho-decaprenol L-rhamnosyltransferase